MIRLKDGARVAGIQPPLLLALIIADQVYGIQSEQCVVTSVSDSKHMPGSLHYIGQAADLRMPGLNAKAAVLAELKSRLGSDYDVLIEADHIHVEYQPKRGVNLAV